MPSIFIIILTLISITHSAYRPQLMLISSSSFFNSIISQKLGPIINKQISTYQVADQHIDEKVDGIHVTANLTKINQTIQINWNANILHPINDYNFTINCKNINMTINSHIDFKVGLTPAQKGELVVTAQKIQADVSLRFQQPKSSQSIGFDVQISKIYVNSSSIVIKIQGKGLDNYIIKAVTNLLKNRIPTIIENAVQTKVNPLISSITSNAIIQPFPVNQMEYIATLNTTEVPRFRDNQIVFPVDLTLTNEVTNETNDQIFNQNLPEQHMFDKVANATITMSSNMVNTALWLINDAKLLHFDVFPSTLGDNPPIALDTLSLSILMPELNKKWPKKSVAIRVQPAAVPKHLYIRNGRILTALSLSTNFIVNLTDISSNLTQCLTNGKCISAVTLNISLPLSLSIKIIEQNFLVGIIHGVRLLQLSKIEGIINVKQQILKQILNTIIQSSIPAVNLNLLAGMQLDISNLNITKKYNITGVFQVTKKDYLGLGTIIKLK